MVLVRKPSQATRSPDAIKTATHYAAAQQIRHQNRMYAPKQIQHRGLPPQKIKKAASSQRLYIFNVGIEIKPPASASNFLARSRVMPTSKVLHQLLD